MRRLRDAFIATAWQSHGRMPDLVDLRSMELLLADNSAVTRRRNRGPSCIENGIKPEIETRGHNQNRSVLKRSQAPEPWFKN